MYYVINIANGIAMGPWKTLVQLYREVPPTIKLHASNDYKIVKEV